ncbi:MAG: WYL domain-containing protein [Lachnospiraceae bacterium]|nr:WYL domain-containing protein [Lachnospiraceae bacterium]
MPPIFNNASCESARLTGEFPWALTWSDENYYLIAYDEEANCLKHFRVDKMKSVCILQDKRIGRDIPIIPSPENGWSETYVDVALSGHFFGWVFALGTSVKIVGPESVVEEMKGQLESVRGLYYYV